MSSCKFCELIGNEEKIENEEIVFENDKFIVITDKYRKTSAGAICLIIPKQHKRNILELTAEYEEGLIKLLSLIGKSMQNAYNCEGIRIWTAVNKEAGQSIFHCHIHIVPCKSIKDRFIALFPGFFDLSTKILTFGNNELSRSLNYELAEKLRKEIELVTSKIELPYRKSIHYGDIPKETELDQEHEKSE